MSCTTKLHIAGWQRTLAGEFLFAGNLPVTTATEYPLARVFQPGPARRR